MKAQIKHNNRTEPTKRLRDLKAGEFFRFNSPSKVVYVKLDDDVKGGRMASVNPDGTMYLQSAYGPDWDGKEVITPQAVRLEIDW